MKSTDDDDYLTMTTRIQYSSESLQNDSNHSLDEPNLLFSIVTDRLLSPRKLHSTQGGFICKDQTTECDKLTSVCPI
jgi:hypothetical protein